jgi:hypothetical protein
MVLTCQQLFNANQNPRINDLSLDLLREYYETYLHPYIFRFDIKGDEQNSSRTIELRFDQENFCHLLAIEKIVKYSVNKRDLWKYKAQAGWDNVVNGTITIDLLRQKKTKKQFDNNKNKYVFFYLIPHLIDSPKGVLYDASVVDGSTQIDCEILFYDNLQSAYVHIGIEYNEQAGYYRPRTFFVERITPNKNGMKYIENQKDITVTKLDKTTIQTP